MPRNVSSKASNKSPAKSTPRSRTKTTEHDDVLSLLAADHRDVTKMFEQFEKMKKDGDDESKQTLIERACSALTLHTRLEEEIFYPAAREMLQETDLLDEAEVEHATAKQLITELNAMQPGDELYEAKFTVLSEYVMHHIQEEEKQIFPKIKKAGIDLDGLADELRHRKTELREELGMEEEGEEDEQETEEPPAPKGRRRMH